MLINLMIFNCYFLGFRLSTPKYTTKLECQYVDREFCSNDLKTENAILMMQQ